MHITLKNILREGKLNKKGQMIVSFFSCKPWKKFSEQEKKLVEDFVKSRAVYKDGTDTYSVSRTFFWIEKAY